jgi:hypothetical protein
MKATLSGMDAEATGLLCGPGTAESGGTGCLEENRDLLHDALVCEEAWHDFRGSSVHGSDPSRAYRTEYLLQSAILGNVQDNRELGPPQPVHVRQPWDIVPEDDRNSTHLKDLIEPKRCSPISSRGQHEARVLQDVHRWEVPRVR